ncbi:methyltransferase [Magnaporthiopsis poae ATCC 64411]|uniref:Methyltransferase n=1 Tax=Magnaporthiopsis poae (strain ATCC 64411 / 73-15) TaxID=644358 RepID=A0A0C4E6N1_MAGP6|nr:methyltransferase [Magnaporthiopsis poae ATCC 64411]
MFGPEDGLPGSPSLPDIYRQLLEAWTCPTPLPSQGDNITAAGVTNITWWLEAPLISGRRHRQSQKDAGDLLRNGGFDVAHTHMVIFHVQDPARLMRELRGAVKLCGGVVCLQLQQQKEEKSPRENDPVLVAEARWAAAASRRWPRVRRCAGGPLSSLFVPAAHGTMSTTDLDGTIDPLALAEFAGTAFAPVRREPDDPERPDIWVADGGGLCVGWRWTATGITAGIATVRTYHRKAHHPPTPPILTIGRGPSPAGSAVSSPVYGAGRCA